MISDTTELDYGYKSQREGLGRLGARHRRGFFLHSALVVDAHTRQVMGLGAQGDWARPPGKVTRVRRVACRKRPTESDVWGRVMDRVPCRGTGVQLVHVCDRGADNFDVFVISRPRAIVGSFARAQSTVQGPRGRWQTRQTRRVDGRRSAPGDLSGLCLGNRHQAARWAKVEVRAVSVTLVRPREGSTAFGLDHDIREVASNVVQVREIDPPKHSKPVRWVLYTAESISTFAACLEVVESYEQRPIVEGYHQCLKTGLQVERRQYESADHLRPVIGLICVQAVRLLQLRDVARRAPDTPAGQLVPPDGSRSSARCSENRDLSTRSVSSCVPSQASAASSVASPTANRAGGQSGAASKLSWPPAAAIAPLSKNVGKDEPAGREPFEGRGQRGESSILSGRQSLLQFPPSPLAPHPSRAAGSPVQTVAGESAVQVPLPE